MTKRNLRSPEEIAKRMLWNAQRAKRDRDVAFALEPHHITPLPERCPVYGFALDYSGGRRSDFSPSLDRIFPRLGYVPGNVVVISWRANRLKQDAAPQELDALAEWLRAQWLALGRRETDQ